MQWLAVMLSDTFRALARPAERALHGMQSLDRASGMLSAPYEREQFVARHETEFPDEQIFPLVPHPHDPVRSLEIKLELNNNTRTVLVQIRNLMQHHLDTLLRVSGDGGRLMPMPFCLLAGGEQAVIPYHFFQLMP